MITSNTSIPFIKAENSENKFYLSQLTSEYNEGDSITTSTDINCRKLVTALKAGDKIRINGTSLTVYADAAVDATSFFVEAITLTQALEINANIAIDEDNMFVQYQRKTEGTVAGFDIDADGMSKGGVEITGWLDSDTMEGATANNIPTAESVKAYVDGQVGTADTLQEVTDNGNTTTNSIMIGSSTSPSEKLQVSGTLAITQNDTAYAGGYFTKITSGYNENPLIIESKYGDLIKAESYGRALSFHTGESSTSEKLRILSNGNVGIGTTSPGALLHTAPSGSIGWGSLGNAGILIGANTGAGIGIDQNEIASKGDHMYIGTITTDKDLILRAGGSTNRIVVKGDTGNVGIGTTSPYAYESTATKLHVDSGGEEVARFEGESDADGSMGVVRIGTSNDRGLYFEGGRTGSVSYGKIGVTNYLGAKTESIYIKSDGKVGIGTTSPAETLEIRQTADSDGLRISGFDDESEKNLRINLDASGHVQATTTTGSNFNLNPQGDLQFKIQSGKVLKVRDASNTELTRITSDGNVGIGTTSPDAPLQVGSVDTSFYSLSSGKSIIIGDNYNLTETQRGTLDLTSTQKTGGNNTGLGPSLTFSQNVSQYVGGYEKVIGAIKTIINTSSNTSEKSAMLFSTHNGSSLSERMRINDNGNVGIGTTTDSGSKLQVEGSITLSNNSDVKFKNSVGTPVGVMRFNSSNELVIFNGNSPNGDIFFKDGGPTGTTNLMIDGATGNVLIGTTTDSGYKLDVNGTQRVQDVLELDDVLTLNGIATPDDPADGKSSIYMDSATGDIKVKINLGGEVVTRTLASYDG